MADEKISGLPDASIPLAGNEFVAIAKGGDSIIQSNYKMTY